MSPLPFLPKPADLLNRTAAAYKSRKICKAYPARPAIQIRRTCRIRATCRPRPASPAFRRFPAWRAALLAAFLLPAPSFAQVLTAGPWKITSSTTDTGGGRSTGGPWTLTGTIGQPDASSTAATAGAFAIAGGFWADVTVIPTGNNGPQLTISRLDAASVRLSWPAEAAGWTLQKSTDLTNWTDIQGIPASIAPGSGTWPLSTGPRHFFRLILK